MTYPVMIIYFTDNGKGSQMKIMTDLPVMKIQVDLFGEVMAKMNPIGVHVNDTGIADRSVPQEIGDTEFKIAPGAVEYQQTDIQIGQTKLKILCEGQACHRFGTWFGFYR